MPSTLEYLKIVLIIQLFYGASISMITYSLPAEYVDNTLLYSQGAQSIEETSSQVTDSMQRQLDIPTLDLGSLVFYSGNILIDLMLNSFFALPSMFGIIIYSIMNIFNFDPYLANTVSLFIAAALAVLYMVFLIGFLVSIRSGRTTGVI